MGKPVSPGQALNLMSVLANNMDWSQFDSEYLQHRFIDKPKEAGAAFAAWLRSDAVAQLRKHVFKLTTGDKRSAEELLQAGQYACGGIADGVYRFVRSGQFRVAQTVEKIDIVLVEIKRDDIRSEEVLGEFARLGLECPTEEDALRFAEMYPEVQKKHRVVFLHDWLVPFTLEQVLILKSWDNGQSQSARSIGLKDFGHEFRMSGKKWYSNYRFAARRPRKV